MGIRLYMLYKAAIHVIDFYLDDERAKERAQIIQLCQRKDAASEELLQGYVREGMRLNPQVIDQISFNLESSSYLFTFVLVCWIVAIRCGRP
jgi:hypothetical protein